jgi:hypothetical protein
VNILSSARDLAELSRFFCGDVFPTDDRSFLDYGLTFRDLVIGLFLDDLAIAPDTGLLDVDCEEERPPLDQLLWSGQYLSKSGSEAWCGVVGDRLFFAITEDELFSLPALRND